MKRMKQSEWDKTVLPRRFTRVDRPEEDGERGKTKWIVIEARSVDQKIIEQVEIIPEPEPVEPSVVGYVIVYEDGIHVREQATLLCDKGSHSIAIVCDTNTPKGQANLDLYKNAERVKREHEEMYRWMKRHAELYPGVGNPTTDGIAGRGEILADIENHRGCKDGCC